jgi:serine/threonine-protein kinase HipA
VPQKTKTTMTKNNSRSILVYADWNGIAGPKLMGQLHVKMLRGKEIFAFEYDKMWLQSQQAQLLDPDLQLYSGLQYHADAKKQNFGLFLDSSPDRWGRLLMRRREAAHARKEGRPQQNLFETDYLLGVYDAHRMGGLRFKQDATTSFLNDNKEMASPPWTSIRELEHISQLLEDDALLSHPDYIKWLNMLFAPGSSLGGARPKASVLGKENDLWIAKFPSKYDDFDIGGWEIVTYELALAAGIEMVASQAQKFTTKHHTFLTKRFDRTNTGNRIHFASAMTLLGYVDGQDYEQGISYLELVEFIYRQGANVCGDLEQLWRRIVFSICVSNTDDHLRNHGFILTYQGWRLSPAYDINPVETGTGLKLNISEDDNALDLSIAVQVCSYFQLSEKRALEIINEVQSAVQNWRKVATKYGISKSEQELKAMAFMKAD